jgi:signal transduction histidine kinase
MTDHPAPLAKRRPVARRLLLRLASLGAALAFVTAGVQLYIEYQRDMDALHARLAEVESSYLPSIRENAWLDDRERLSILAAGIENLSRISRVQVITPKGEVIAQAGIPAKEPLVRNFDLTHDYSGRPVLLGRLEVTSDLAEVKSAALRRMGVTLAANMVLLAALSALLYWQVHTLVAGRLGAIAAYARRLGTGGEVAATPPAADQRHDELAELGQTLWTMHRELSAAHEALAIGEARYRELFTSSPVPLWEHNYTAVKSAIDAVPNDVDFAAWLDANPEFVRQCASLVRVLDVNEAGVAMHRGGDREELTARLTAVFAPSSFDAFRRQLEAIRAGVWDLTLEAQLRTLDGEAIDVVMHWHVPPSHRHNLARVIVATEDVSALKAARRSSDITLERLMEANAELERFTFVASHDLQEPVRAVVSFTQLLERRLETLQQRDAEAAEFLGYLRAAAQRMQAQVAGLQDYARAGQGNSLTPLRLDDALADARMLLDPVLASVGATVKAGPLPQVLGDRGQLAQLFRHLLDNAIKYRRLDSLLVVTIDAQPQGAHWRVTVRDNGIGIDPAYAATVFELFRRLHGPGQFPGAGIGLTICRRIVERHGGVITIDASQTGGTAVVFTLPASDLATLPA